MGHIKILSGAIRRNLCPQFQITSGAYAADQWTCGLVDPRTIVQRNRCCPLQVRFRGCRSAFTVLSCGVPQGSVLGPILFLIYAADLIRLIEGSGLRPHLYADNTQIYGFCRPDDTQALTDRTSACIHDVATSPGWSQTVYSSIHPRRKFCGVRRQVNSCSSTASRTRRYGSTPTMSSLLSPFVTSGYTCISTAIMSMTTHVSLTVSSYFAYAASVAPSANLFFCPSSPRWFCQIIEVDNYSVNILAVPGFSTRYLSSLPSPNHGVILHRYPINSIASDWPR